MKTDYADARDAGRRDRSTFVELAILAALEKMVAIAQFANLAMGSLVNATSPPIR